jgi:hypothetical protein
VRFTKHDMGAMSSIMQPTHNTQVVATKTCSKTCSQRSHESLNARQGYQMKQKIAE